MTKQIIVRGNVQGVFYRKSTAQKAVELNITGTVKNKPNGDVEIIASGTEEQLLELEQWCKIGPPAANVLGLKSTIIEDQYFSSFNILR